MFKYGFGRITCGTCSASIGIKIDNYSNTNDSETCTQRDECDHFKFEIGVEINKCKNKQNDSMSINMRAICKQCNDDSECCSTCTNQNSRSGFKVVSGHGTSCYFSYEYTSDENSDFINRPVRGKPYRPTPILPTPVPYQLKQSNFLDFYTRGPSESYAYRRRV